MSGGLVLAIDQGTTNTKALLVGRVGSAVFPRVRTCPFDSFCKWLRGSRQYRSNCGIRCAKRCPSAFL